MALGAEPVRRGNHGGGSVRSGAPVFAELDQGAGLLGSGGKNPAGTVVFEPAPDNGDAVCQQRGGERVALKSRHIALVKAHCQRLVAQNAPAQRKAVWLECGGHFRRAARAGRWSSRERVAPRISCVCVSRSTVSHWRQP